MESDAFRSRPVESRRLKEQASAVKPERRRSYLELLAKSREMQDPLIDNDYFDHSTGAWQLTEKAIRIISRNVGLRVERNRYLLPPEGKIEMEYDRVMMRESNIGKELQPPDAANLKYRVFYEQVIIHIANDPNLAENRAWRMLNPDEQYFVQKYNNQSEQTDSSTGSTIQLPNEVIIGMISRSVGLRVERNTSQLPLERKILWEFLALVRQSNIGKELPPPDAANLKYRVFYEQVIIHITKDPNRAKNIAWGMLDPDERKLVRVYNSQSGQTDSGTGSTTQLPNEVIRAIISKDVGLRVERNTSPLPLKDKIEMAYTMVISNIDKKLPRPDAANLRYQTFYEQVIIHITNDPNRAKNRAWRMLNPDQQYLDQVYRNNRRIHRSGQQGIDTDSLPLYENIPQIRRVVLAVNDAEQQYNEIDTFLKFHGEHSTGLGIERSDDLRECEKRCRQLETSHSSAMQELKSVPLNPERLQAKYGELTQSQEELDNVFQPLKLRDTIIYMERQAPRAQDLLKSHRAFFTGEEGQRADRLWQEFSGRKAAANGMLASRTRTPKILRSVQEQLDKSWRALDEALLPFRLQDTIMDVQGRYTQVLNFRDFHQAFLTEFKGSESGREICRQFYESLANFQHTIKAWGKRLTSETITPEILQVAQEQLDKSRTAVEKALVPIYVHLREESIDDAQSDVSVGQNDEAGEEIVIERIQPEPLMFRDCTVASVRDFKRLAKSLRRALQPGKSPERVFRVLYFLLREPEAIEKLKSAFQRQDPNGRSLETALRERFRRGSPELEYALQLLGKEATGIDQIINRRPASEEEYRALAERVRGAFLRGDRVTAYRALTPFQRNAESLSRFNEVYKRAFNTSLRADMIQHLPEGDSRQLGLFLLGDDAWATRVVTLPEAERLSKMALQLTFQRDDGVRVPVPYEAAGTDGSQCMHRNHIISASLTEMGYRPKKIFVEFLRINEQGQKYDAIATTCGTMWWHTACCMWVRTNSDIELRILDPSGCSSRDLDKPILWTINEWLGEHAKQDSYRFLSFEEWKKLVASESNRESLPAGQPYVFIANRNYVGIPSLRVIEDVFQFTDIPNQYSNTDYQLYGLARITESTTWVPYSRIAKAIRKELQEPTIKNNEEAEGFLNNITRTFEVSLSEFHLKDCPSTQFSNRISKAYTDLMRHLRAIEGVSPEVVACFEQYLDPPRGPGLTLAPLPPGHVSKGDDST